MELSDSHHLIFGNSSKMLAAGNKFPICFTIESQLCIWDKNNTVIENYYQAEACKAEHVFGPEPVFKSPGFTFTPVFGIESGVIFRSHKSGSRPKYREVFHSRTMLNGYTEYLMFGKYKKISFKNIVQDSLKCKNLIATTIISDGEKYHAEITYPIRTINISERINKIQIDTGPVVIPVFAEKTDALVDCLRLAYVSFSEKNEVNFIVEEETAATVDYTKNYVLDATNEVYEIS